MQDLLDREANLEKLDLKDRKEVQDNAAKQDREANLVSEENLVYQDLMGREASQE